jgi:hypothetical protein
MLHVLQWAIHVCFKCIFQMFYLFQTYVASVSFGCCKTRSGCCIYMQVFPGVFIRMLQVFHLDICMFLQWLHMCFQVFFLVFCKCFRRILQVYQLFWEYVASVLPRCCKNRLDFAHVAMRMRSRARHERSLCAV